MTRDATNPPERFARLAATVRVEMSRITRVVTEAENTAATFAERTPELLERIKRGRLRVRTPRTFCPSST
jgi:hypothetical protein